MSTPFKFTEAHAVLAGTVEGPGGGILAHPSVSDAGQRIVVVADRWDNDAHLCALDEVEWLRDLCQAILDHKALPATSEEQ